MITFLAPWAAAGLVLLAGPLLVHMLLRRHARRVRFPAARFLIETPAAAVRLRRPSDLGLLLVRLAVVCAAITAAAQPVVITPRRAAQWDARVIRAVVVDTSASAAGHPDVTRLAEQELTVFRAQRFDTTDPRDGVARAADWLAGAPPGRREIVILSDFQRGTLDAADLASVPAVIGVRTIRIGTQPASRTVELPNVMGFRDAVWRPSLRVDAGATAVTWTKAAGRPQLSWLTTAQPDTESDAASRAMRAAMLAGIAAGDDSRRVHIRFAGAPAEAADRHAVRTAWMAEAALALRGSPLLRQTSATVRTAEHAGRLIVEADVAAVSVDAPAVVRAVVLAVRPAVIADREAEVATVSDAELASWRRDAAPVSTSGRAPSLTQHDSDAKWFWGIALALLACESWLRRRHPGSTAQQVRDAA